MRLSTLILFFLICQSLPAQAMPAGFADAPEARNQAASKYIKISTNLVTVPVSVTDGQGENVSQLGVQDFEIEEDGRIEQVSKLVQAGASPLQLVLVFDLSGSIYSDFEFERAAASRFIEKVWKQGDMVSIITISNKPQVHLADSTSPEEALAALARLEPKEDATAFFDAVVAAAELQSLSTAPGTRQAAVIFSDGEDNRSDSVFSDALSSIRRSNTVVYSINPSGASVRLNEISKTGQLQLASLAGKTGGAAFVSNRLEELDGIYDRIAFELRAQYLLSYYSSNTLTDGSFRKISVTVPGKPGLHVRAREGYYAIGVTLQTQK
jgi:Ca-activated chloride channel family protein